MRKILLLALIVLSTEIFGQAPEGINYQAVARDVSGSEMTNTPCAVQVQILNSSLAVIYQEDHSTTTNAFGLFNIVIGQGTNATATFSSINWSASPLYLKVFVDANGSGLVDMGYTQLWSVPYALYAKESANGPQGLPGVSCWDLDADGVNDPAEDINADNQWNTLDCQGATGPTGPSGAQGTQGTQGVAGPSGAQGPGIDSIVQNANGTMTIYYNASSTTTNPLIGATGATGPQGDGITSITDNGNGTLTITFGASGNVVTGSLYGPSGPSGAVGATGPAGPSGTTGATGDGITTITDNGDGTFTISYGSSNTFITSDFTGPTGATGPAGPTGTAGTNGATGAQGPTGTAGTNGATGAQGPTGTAGTNGATGAQGPTGTAGTNGATGAQGPTGTAGTNGATGAQGPTGTAGTNGATGVQGPTGTAGTNGATGSQGPTGTNGSTGPTGPTGPTVAGSSGQTVYYNGSTLASTSTIYNDVTNNHVGLGTTGPGYRLHVVAPGTEPVVAYFESSNTNWSSVYLNSTAPASGVMYGYNRASLLKAYHGINAADDWFLSVGSFGSALYAQTTTGYVGVNTNSPSANLDVAGSARIRGLTGGPGVVTADALGNLSLTAGTAVTGSGTTNYVARWTSPFTLGTGALTDWGASVGIGIGAAAPNYNLSLPSNAFIGVNNPTSSQSGGDLTITAGNAFGANQSSGRLFFRAGQSTGLGGGSGITQITFYTSPSSTVSSSSSNASLAVLNISDEGRTTVSRNYAGNSSARFWAETQTEVYASMATNNSATGGTGVYGVAQSTSGTTIGVHGSASGGTSNWAGYFSSGNVFVQNSIGVNQPTPSYPVDIRTTTGNYGVTQTDGTILMGTYVGNGGPTGGSIGTMTNHPFFIFTASGGAKLTVMPSGFVGVGVTNPTTAKLEINEPTSTYTTYSTNTYSGTSDHYAYYGRSVNNPGYGYGGWFEGGYYGVTSTAVGTNFSGLAVGVSGVATGTASVGSRYGIYGSASGGAINYGVYCAGNGGYTGTWANVSDAKFKENVAPMSGSLARIMQLRPVTYTMKRDEFPYMNFSEGTQVGFIAQEMEKVFPELVTNGVDPGPINPETGRHDHPVEFKGINYIGLAPVLVEAIQQQQGMIDSLQTQINTMNGGATCNGNVTTDASGYATVQLPAGYETANSGFRYQLTIVGSDFAQAIVYQEISNNQFVIRTDKPGVKVSWQVSGQAK